MNPDFFAEWLRRCGHRVIRTQSSYWHSCGLRIYQAFPYHWIINPAENELSELIQSNHLIGLRYSSPLSASAGLISYHVISTNDTRSLETLNKKARYDVRKGLEKGTVEEITFARMADEGWDLRAETLKRQGRVAGENRDWWIRLCKTAEGLPGFEAWGFLSRGVLGACLLAFSCDDCFTILYQQSRTSFLSMGANNALTFFLSKTALSRPETANIFYGLHSLDAPSTVDDFKFRMGYIPKPTRQRVMFHPLLKPFMNKASYAILSELARIWPANYHYTKAEGMLRFYLGGLRSLPEQKWPPCLASRL